MQPWDQVQINDDSHPRHGEAGLVTAVRTTGDVTQVTVKLDTDGAAVAVEPAQLRLLGR